MSLKDRVRTIIATPGGRDALIELLLLDRKVVTMLNRLLFDPDELIRWRAVTGLGWVAAEDPYLLEKVISRLFYTMNDDSGSIGWTAPQALGEICYHDPDLVEDYFPIVITAIDHEIFRPGAIWAVGRIAEKLPYLVEDTGPALMARLEDDTAEVRGLATWALGRTKYKPAAHRLDALQNDPETFRFYDGDRLRVRSVGDLAGEALTRLERG